MIEGELFPVLSIVGRSNSGKTTLIERLIPRLVSHGLRVATIKHHHWGDFEIDTPGKDSWRHTRAGSVATALAGSHQLAIFYQTGDRLPLNEILRRLAPSQPDIVVTEGFKEGPFPKVEVVRQTFGEPPLCGRSDGLIALMTDADWERGVPRFGLDDVEGLAKFVVARFSLETPD